jgi:flagellar biosynthesis protein FlhG
MMHRENRTLSVSVLSGKGGVGKTSIALNLSYALHGLGRSLMVMDCDLGLANLDVMLGISPERNLQDLLSPGVEADAIRFPLEQAGLDLLPAASGVPELVEMDEDVRAHLLQKLNSLFKKYDFLVLDLGAGISSTVLSFAVMSRTRIVVLTPEPTSLTDSYAMIKVLATRHGIKDFLLVINQTAGPEEAQQTYLRISNASEKFLGIKPILLGHVRQDPMVNESIRRQVPLLKLAPRSKAGQDILTIARRMDALRNRLLPELLREQALEMGIDFSQDRT